MVRDQRARGPGEPQYDLSTQIALKHINGLRLQSRKALDEPDQSAGEINVRIVTDVAHLSSPVMLSKHSGRICTL